MKKKQPTIADVLPYAADHTLAATKIEYHFVEDKQKHSCCAVTNACFYLNVSYSTVIEGLKEMGCPTHSLDAFKDRGYDNFSEKNQQTRYMWLKWAALMAEEQGV